MGYLWIALTIALTVYGQLILKWRLGVLGAMPTDMRGAVIYLLGALLDLYVLSSFGAAFLGGLTWMAALTRFDISYAYPFMALSFVLVLIFGWMLLGEPLTAAKVVGMAFIILGIWLGAR